MLERRTLTTPSVLQESNTFFLSPLFPENNPALGKRGSRLHDRSSFLSSAVLLLRGWNGSAKSRSPSCSPIFLSSSSSACFSVARRILRPRSG